MKSFMCRFLCCLLVLLLPICALADVTITIIDEYGNREDMDLTKAGSAGETSEDAAEGNEQIMEENSARKDFIDSIIDLAEQKCIAANGRVQRAHYASDIYVCKNFTVYLFRQNRDRFRMAEYPDVELVIPDNKPKKECKEYVYGCEWKDISPEDGNPFYVAASFRYDPDLSKEENQELAREMMRKVQRGDYFQMAADYYYGKGAHSLVFISDYDSETNTVHWTDSNMRGEKRDGIRYGLVQYDKEKDIDFFVDAFCLKKHGATIYRLRDDIIYAE